MKQSTTVIAVLALTMLLGACAQRGFTAGSPPAAAQPSSVPGQPSATAPQAAGGSSAPAGSATGQASVPLTKVTLAMAYIPSVQFAPLYVAQEKGYFKAAGLDVTFDYGMETDLLKLVGTNQLQFMIGSGDEVILGRSQGVPVRYVFRWYRQFPVVLFAKASEGIKTPKDLEGKTLGISALSGADYVGWKALSYAAGVDTSKVRLQVIGFTQAATVMQGRVDAAMDYAVDGPVQVRLAGQQVTVIPVSAYMDLPSNGIITNDQTIRDHPQWVAALVQGMLHGLQDTLADPNAAFAACLRAVPEAGGAQTAVNRAIFDEVLKVWQGAPGTLGQSDPASWAKAAAFMQKTGLVNQLVPVNDLFTNQFVAGE